MNRPIPIFRFVFAAYYATTGNWEHEEEGFFKNDKKIRKPEFPALALVVNNEVEPKPRRALRLREAAGDCKAD